MEKILVGIISVHVKNILQINLFLSVEFCFALSVVSYDA